MKRASLLLLSVPVLAGLMMTYAFTGSVKLPDDEKYKVIKVNGEIIVKRSGKQLITGDEVLASTPLDFKTAEARAAVVSPTKGRFVLTAASQGGKTNLVPGMNNVASRSGALLNVIDLQNHFSGDYVILDKNRLKISKEAYPMNDKSFFFLRFSYNNETINKRLSFSGDTLILERSSIFSIDNKPVQILETMPCMLFYRNGEANENRNISSFTAVFPDLESLEAEMRILMENNHGKKASEKMDEVMGYVTEFYGKADKDNLQRWINSHFKL